MSYHYVINHQGFETVALSWLMGRNEEYGRGVDKVFNGKFLGLSM